MKTDPAVLAAIRAEMARHQVRQHDIATRLGIAQQCVSARLTGKTPLSAEEIQIIADEIGCHPEAFGV
jgi:predicted transcriptional regulator